MTDTHLRRIIACACAACGAQPLHHCDTLEGKELGVYCLIPEGQTPFQDWVSLGFQATALYEKSKAPIAMRLPCERCGTLHIDVGHFATHPHHTHTCQHCGLNWRPAKEHTVGVQWVPGFKNEEPPVPIEGLGSQANAIHWQPGMPTGPSGKTVGEPVQVPAGTYRVTAEVVSVRGGDQISVSITHRPIVEKSTWQYRDGWHGVVTKIWPAALGQRKELICCGPPGGMIYEWPRDAFLRAFTWVSDP